MTDIIGDYADIHRRMKGELKKVVARVLPDPIRPGCSTCRDVGWEQVSFTNGAKIYIVCPGCGNPNGKFSP